MVRSHGNCKEKSEHHAEYNNNSNLMAEWIGSTVVFWNVIVLKGRVS